MDGSNDDFERGRQQRVRQLLEENAACIRTALQRGETPKELAAWKALEEQRMIDERAGRETKSFADMNGFEFSFAMASYPEGRYPAALEKLLSDRASEPAAELDAEDQEALLETLSIQQQWRQWKGGNPAIWMMERLQQLFAQRCSLVSLKAATVLLEIAADLGIKPPSGTTRNS